MKPLSDIAPYGALIAAPVPVGTLDPVVTATGLSKTFGATRALHEVDIAVQPGEIRALVGRNGAGKSTLVSLLTGMVTPDAGSVSFSGVPAPAVRELWKSKVACVYQHSKIVPTLSCAENLFLAENAKGRRLISWRRMREEGRAILSHWGLDVDVEAPAGTLEVGQRQSLEIARALAAGSRFVILDEPTAKLDAREADRLFARLRVLASKGVGILFISHHLDEIFELCSTVTVLRDGRRTMDQAVEGLTTSGLVEAMVGAAAPSLRRPHRVVPGDVAAPVHLDVRGLGLADHFEDVTFQVRARECVGLAGLTGSGKEAIGEALAGMRAIDSGSIELGGTPLPGGDVAAHISAGVGFVPQDRHRDGLVLGMSIAENATMTIPDWLGRLGFVSPGLRNSATAKMITGLDIKAAGPDAPVSSLSGGNQQKVVLARALARRPSALVLVNPTSGVDVGSKASLFSAIRETIEGGTAVVVISDELDELDLCDRVIVVRSHRLVREFSHPWSEREVIAEMEGGTQ